MLMTVTFLFISRGQTIKEACKIMLGLKVLQF